MEESIALIISALKEEQDHFQERHAPTGYAGILENTVNGLDDAIDQAIDEVWNE